MKAFVFFADIMLGCALFITNSSTCPAVILRSDACVRWDLLIAFEEYRLVCKGYKFAKIFFTNYGYATIRTITIHFEPSIEIGNGITGLDKEGVYRYCNNLVQKMITYHLP